MNTMDIAMFTDTISELSSFVPGQDDKNKDQKDILKARVMLLSMKEHRRAIIKTFWKIKWKKKKCGILETSIYLAIISVHFIHKDCKSECWIQDFSFLDDVSFLSVSFVLE